MAAMAKEHMARDRNVAIANFDLYVQTWSVRACGKHEQRKLSFRAETDYLLSPSSGRITQGSQHRR